MDIQFNFLTIASAMFKLFALTAAGYVLYKTKMATDEFVDRLSLLIVRVIFPALIVSKNISNFSFQEYNLWWILPLSAAMFSLFGLFLGYLAHYFLKGHESLKEFMCASGFQNCGYLPMNLIAFTFTGVAADRLLVQVFLFIIGFDVLMWSLVPLFLSGKLRKGFSPKALLNPPVIATVFSLLWVAVFGRGTMPALIMAPLGQLGAAAFPLVMIILGAYLARYRAYVPRAKTPVIMAAVVKLIIFPALVLPVLLLLPLAPDYKFILFLEAIVPTAVALVIIGSYTDSDSKFFSSAIFYTHLAGVFTIPLWLTVFRALIR